MNKNLLTALFVLLFSTITYAQTGIGQKYIGGSFYLNYNEAGNSSTITYPQGITQYYNTNILNLNVSPEFGFFLNKNWAIGIQPGYSRVSGKETSNYYASTTATTNYTYVHNYHTDIVGLAINLRYYWMLGEKFGIYPQFGVSTNHVLNNFKVGSLNAGGGPNLVFFPNKKLGINMGFGNFNYNYNYQTNGSTLNLSLNNNFSFGVNYYWGRK